jgi:carboxylate-amine ligase
MTLGVEVELQLLDWRTQNLCPAATRLFAAMGGETPRIKSELFQSMIEINTGVCSSIADVRTDLLEARAELAPVCDALGLAVAAAGTHPFATIQDRILFPADRYRYLLDRNQWIARQLYIFGLHVHLGMRSGDFAIAMMNAIIPELAPLLALSASSPLQHGQDTGLASSRVTVFESMPTAGTPPKRFATWDDFERFYEVMVASRAIRSAKDLWWDVRPNAGFGTLEIRICDALPTVRETVALVALLRCLAEHLSERIEAGETFRAPSAWRLKENKWRAARWGLDALYCADDAGTNVPMKEHLGRMITLLAPYARTLDCEAELLEVRATLDRGASYQRQRHILEQTKSFGAVVHALMEEWTTDAPMYAF